MLSVSHQRTVKVGQAPIEANERNHRHLSARENPISLMLNLILTTVLSAANASELSGKFVFVSDSFRSRSRAQICLLERVDSQSAKRGGFQAGRAKLNSDAITQDCASSSALSFELTGAAGSKK